jgi:hypothetical protein
MVLCDVVSLFCFGELSQLARASLLPNSRSFLRGSFAFFFPDDSFEQLKTASNEVTRLVVLTPPQLTHWYTSGAVFDLSNCLPPARSPRTTDKHTTTTTTMATMASFDVGIFWDYGDLGARGGEVEENVRISRAMRLDSRAVCSVVQDKLRGAVDLTCGNMGFKARV